MGIPSIRQGGIKKGERFDFIYCGACGTWYRKNDYRIVSNVRTMDIGINPALDPLGSLSTSFADEPGYMSDVANISTDSVRIAMNKNLLTTKEKTYNYYSFTLITGLKLWRKRICYKCNEIKDLNYFHRRKEGYRTICIDCLKKTYTPGFYFKRRLKSHGIDEDEYN